MFKKKLIANNIDYKHKKVIIIVEKEIKLKEKFNNLASINQPKPNSIKNCIYAFLVGGLICDVGQYFNNIFLSFGVPYEEVGTYVSIVMVFIGAFLTGIGVYDKIANFAGAGTVVPITGFANSIVAPAIEFKNEGYILGIGAKMFTIAGPVLVYGISSSFIVGLIYFLLYKL